jgi:predicted deacylase
MHDSLESHTKKLMQSQQTVRTIFHPSRVDADTLWSQPGKTLFELAFHFDGSWGNAMVPMAVINGAAGPGPGVVCFGGTHGNELEGQVSIWRLMHELNPEEMRGRVILIPRLNQPACVAGTRPSPVDGVNMNRAFPGDPQGTITSRIAHFVTTSIFPLVDVVLDIHAAGSGSNFALCSSFHLVNDPDQFAEMKTVASLFDTPFVFIYSSDMARGLLTDEAEALGKVTIGGEFGHSKGVDPQGVRHAYQGIRNVLHHYGLLPGEVQRVDPDRDHPPRLVEAIDLESYTPAPFTGVYEPKWPVGTRVEEGQLVGWLYNFELVGVPPLPVHAPRDGYILLQSFQAPVNKGDTMLVIAQEYTG